MTVSSEHFSGVNSSNRKHHISAASHSRTHHQRWTPGTHLNCPPVQHWQLKSNFLCGVPEGRVSGTELQYRGVWHIFIFIQRSPDDSGLICLVTSSLLGLHCFSWCVRATSSAEDAVTVKARRPGGSGPRERRTSLSVLTFVSLCPLWTGGFGGFVQTWPDRARQGETPLDKRGSHRKWRRGGGSISNEERWAAVTLPATRWTAAGGF